MKLTEKLYESAKDIWTQYLSHPFIREMAEGSLPVEKYRYYMLQDYAYLRDYIKIYAILISKSNDFKEIEFLCDSMMATLRETSRVHVPYMKQLGITEQSIREVVPHIENSSYTHYMICESQSRDILCGLVALLNCSWTYAYIAEHITEQYPYAVKHKIYGSWFAGYTCDDYRDTNQALIDIVDRMSAKINEDETRTLCEIFTKCSMYELKFWNMAYAMGKV